MLVSEVMNKGVRTCRKDDTVRQAAQEMNKWRIGSLIVVDGPGKVIGIITERDILTDVVAKGLRSDDVDVKEVMTEDVIEVEATATLEDAAEIMTLKKIKKLPVVKKGQLVGIVTATDLIMYEHSLIEKVSELLQTGKKAAAACG
jgi:CBS domain-containing protein